MSKRRTRQSASPHSQQEAMTVARATQRPGQTKEQTKLIAQGIQKGIEQYKKQQSAKARELDKKLKKLRHHSDDATQLQAPEVVTVYRQSKLAWLLLLLSWAGFAIVMSLAG